jgi:SET domain-containing protein
MKRPRRKPPFRVRSSPIHGRGVFATRRIRPGQRLIEYTGELIDDEEAAERYDDEAGSHHHTFLFGVKDGTLIDAGRGGNDARFINHSCEPNCEAVLDDGHVFIEAIRNIQPGVELAYDYSLEPGSRLPPGWKERYACHCGAPTCRGTILKLPKRKKTSRAAAKRR